jgi:hypothetical protein
MRPPTETIPNQRAKTRPRMAAAEASRLNASPRFGYTRRVRVVAIVDCGCAERFHYGLAAVLCNLVDNSTAEQRT